MANHVTSSIEIYDGNDEVREWFASLSKRLLIPEDEREGRFSGYWRSVEDMFDTWEHNENDPEYIGWYHDNIGPKWCHVFDADEDRLMFESAWGYPDKLFLRIAKEAHKIDPEVILSATYEDEMPNFFGSCVYADGDLYDEEYIGEESYGYYDIKFWWDEDEDGEEPEDFEPDYEKMHEIQMSDISDMVEGLKEMREEENDSE